MLSTRFALILVAAVISAPVIAAPEIQADAPGPPEDSPGRAGETAGRVRVPAPFEPLYGATTDIGAPKQLRFGLQGDYFSASNLLVDGDKDERLRASLAVAFAPTGWLELFTGILASSNRNERIEPGRGDPERMTAIGDLVLGAKSRWVLTDGLSASAMAATRFYTSQDSLGFDLGATSVSAGPLVTYDLRHRLRLPVRVSAAADYVFDNSAAAIAPESDPQSRYVGNLANGIGRDRVRFGAAIDTLIRPARGPALLPYVRYHGEVVTASADPAFATPGCAASQCVGRDQQGVALGLRAQVTDQIGIGFESAFGLRSFAAAYGSPEPPLSILLGLSFFPPSGGAEAHAPERIVTRVMTIEVPTRPATGTLSGSVTTGPGGVPIAGALVSVDGRKNSRVVTDPDGTFVVRDVSPGPAKVSVEAATFEPAKLEAVVWPGGDASLRVMLAPRPTTGEVRGRILDDAGQGIGAVVRFVGAGGAEEVKASDDGLYAARLAPGHYSVRVSEDAHLARAAAVDVVINEATALEMSLRRRPAAAGVTVAEHGLDLKAEVAFEGVSSKLAPAAEGTLDEVADLLIIHPEVKKVRIAAHWDSLLSPKAALDLTTAQALAVRDYLVGTGVEATRLEAVGLGATKAFKGASGDRLFQMLRSGQPANRRVQFLFVE